MGLAFSLSVLAVTWEAAGVEWGPQIAESGSLRQRSVGACHVARWRATLCHSLAAGQDRAQQF